MSKINDSRDRLISANFLLIKSRWFYVSALALTGVLSKITGGFNANANFPFWLMVVLAAIIYGYNIFFYIYLKTNREISEKGLKLLSFLQLCLDQVLITMVILFAGGIISIGFLYYFYPISVSAFFFSIIEVAAVASFAALLYSGLIIMQFFNILPFFARYNLGFENILAHNQSAVITNLFAVVSSFYIIAIFSGLMAKNLRRKEKEVTTEKNKSEALVGNLSDGIIFIDNYGKLSIVNQSAEKLLGIKAGEIVGRNIKNLAKNYSKDLNEVLSVSGRESNMDSRHRPGFTYRVISFSIYDQSRKTIGEAKVIHDISREKFIEKMKSEFITIAGHQLRTPLSALKSAVALLRHNEYGKISKDQEKILSQSYEYIENMIKMVNDLLNVSSIEEGQYNYKYELCDIHLLLREVCGQFIDSAEKKGIDFKLEILNDLSEMMLDADKIKLALGGVINNAIVYTDKGGLVTVQCGFDQDNVLITVEDNGIGIFPDDQRKIFTKFFRADNALKTSTEGNGLDLFVAKNIIDNHSGKIWFESRTGEGTRFYIQLPVKNEKVEKE